MNDVSQNLKNLAQDAKSMEGNGSFMEPGTKTRHPQGRHKKDCICSKCSLKKDLPKTENKTANPQGAGPVDPQASKKLVEPLFKMMSNLAVEKTGEKEAGMSITQLDHCSTLGGALVDKYLPDYMSRYGLEIGFLFAFGSWGLGVAMIYKAKAEKIKSERHNQRPRPPMQPVESKNENGIHPAFMKQPKEMEFPQSTI